MNKAGFRIDVEHLDRPRLPVILLGDQALALIREIFDRPGLFHNAPRIRRRVAAWGHEAKPVSLEHSAVMVSEQMLLDAIRPSVGGAGHRDATWTILATRPLPELTDQHAFGSRSASVAPVTLQATSPVETCWIESLDEGWLFLTPDWLLSVGASADVLLAQSRVVVSQIADFRPSQGTFPAYARITWPLAGAGWLACGSAAMAFDPICGDGTAHAIREAILASAVLRGIANGGSTQELLSHYQMRLTAGFQRHLMLCRQFYESGGRARFWRSELAAIDRGIEWCGNQMARHTGFRYQLRGFELEAVR
ncbi:MAG: hypothetical protein JOZ32_21785 [Bryobacterales bacterium]|nr:hypothetical protein [Bryobacterales bacterium]